MRVAAPAGDPPPWRAGASWRRTAGAATECGRDHGQRGGSLDERARRLSHDEYAVAEQLVGEGHEVRSLATRPGQGRTADLLVCGAPVEVKSWLSRDERGGRVPGARSVANKLLQAEGQAATVVLNGRGSGLTEVAARRGMARYTELPHRANVAAVRVLGDGFDLGWTRRQMLQLRRTPRTGLQPGLDPGVSL